ncbi:hypothetical protein C0J52_16585 [Blattella germanica]|nr:hypothetical protein C0J52_16585 [Blattella germanica]
MKMCLLTVSGDILKRLRSSKRFRSSENSSEKEVQCSEAHVNDKSEGEACFKCCWWSEQIRLMINTFLEIGNINIKLESEEQEESKSNLGIPLQSQERKQNLKVIVLPELQNINETSLYPDVILNAKDPQISHKHECKCVGAKVIRQKSNCDSQQLEPSDLSKITETINTCDRSAERAKNFYSIPSQNQHFKIPKIHSASKNALKAVKVDGNNKHNENIQNNASEIRPSTVPTAKDALQKSSDLEIEISCDNENSVLHEDKLPDNVLLSIINKVETWRKYGTPWTDRCPDIEPLSEVAIDPSESLSFGSSSIYCNQEMLSRKHMKFIPSSYKKFLPYEAKSLP